VKLECQDDGWTTWTSFVKNCCLANYYILSWKVACNVKTILIIIFFMCMCVVCMRYSNGQTEQYKVQNANKLRTDTQTVQTVTFDITETGHTYCAKGINIGYKHSTNRDNTKNSTFRRVHSSRGLAWINCRLARSSAMTCDFFFTCWGILVEIRERENIGNIEM